MLARAGCTLTGPTLALTFVQRSGVDMMSQFKTYPKFGWSLALSGLIALSPNGGRSQEQARPERSGGVALTGIAATGIAAEVTNRVLLQRRLRASMEEALRSSTPLYDSALSGSQGLSDSLQRVRPLIASDGVGSLVVTREVSGEEAQNILRRRVDQLSVQLEDAIKAVEKARAQGQLKDSLQADQMIQGIREDLERAKNELKRAVDTLGSKFVIKESLPLNERTIQDLGRRSAEVKRVELNTKLADALQERSQYSPYLLPSYRSDVDRARRQSQNLLRASPEGNPLSARIESEFEARAHTLRRSANIRSSIILSITAVGTGAAALWLGAQDSSLETTPLPLTPDVREEVSTTEGG